MRSAHLTGLDSPHVQRELKRIADCMQRPRRACFVGMLLGQSHLTRKQQVKVSAQGYSPTVGG